jgi:hypothetical protein
MRFPKTKPMRWCDFCKWITDVSSKDKTLCAFCGKPYATGWKRFASFVQRKYRDWKMGYKEKKGAD